MKVKITKNLVGEGYNWPINTVVETDEAERLIAANVAVAHVEKPEPKKTEAEKPTVAEPEKVTRTTPIADETR